MKHNFFSLLSVAILFSSCSSVYHYVQVFEAKSSSQSAQIKNEGGGMLYEDNNCAVFYSLWANGGDASFAIYNKTNEIMYVDLSKSFFVRNGIANDYYKERAWSETNTSTTGTQATASAAAFGNVSYSYGVGATYLGNFGSLPFTSADPVLTTANAQRSGSYGLLRSAAIANSYATSKSSLISIKEQKIMAIPPHASKIVAEYSISTELLLDCDLSRYPEQSASISFNENNSPLNFTNYITYKLGENDQEIVVKNEFYIAKVTNYAKPSIYKFVEREKKPCQNLTSDESKNYKENYPFKVFDKIYLINTSNCFYLEYEKQSNRKLYEADNTIYYYNELYNGYTTTGNDQQNYQQRLLNPFKQGWK